jgi:hypothetical protein
MTVHKRDLIAAVITLFLLSTGFLVLVQPGYGIGAALAYVAVFGWLLGNWYRVAVPRDTTTYLVEFALIDDFGRDDEVVETMNLVVGKRNVSAGIATR